MKTEQTPATIQKVTGQWTRSATRGTEWGRVGLNISNSETDEEFRVNARVPRHSDPELWNAVGSRRVGSRFSDSIDYSEGSTHLPVIEVAGTVDIARNGRRAALTTLSGNPYTPDSLLRDVLGDNGIDLEVFEETTATHSATGIVGSITGSKVVGLVLRTPRQAEMFEVDPHGHDHGDNLYIQEVFGESDHQTLIDAMGKLGLVSPEWQAITEKEGMGIVRTPWAHQENLSATA